jgi:hypothetical protein
MATDPNKKTLRHFQCRDYLWETFEQMSGELECSVDYLINEAMRQYARSRSAGGRTGASAAASPSIPPPREGPSSTIPPNPPPAERAPPMQGRLPPPTMPGRPMAAPQQAAPPMGAPRLPSLSSTAAPMARPPGTPALPMSRPVGPAIPPLARPGGAPPLQRPSGAPPPLPGGASGGPMIPSMPRMAPAQSPAMPRVPAMQAPGPPAMPPPQPPPMAQPMPAPSPTGAPVLYAIYQGQRYPVMKEEFIIGRGAKTSDLVIKDSNVSRRHAVVVLHNGQFWMVDQQSTNGVEFMGAKIDRKRIEEGDVFKICDYEVLFTYR